MKKIYRAGMEPGIELVQRCTLPRLGFGVVVAIGKAPEYAFHMKAVYNGQGAHAVDPGRETEKGHFIVVFVSEDVLELFNIVALGIQTQRGHTLCRVGAGVVADHMAFVDHSLYQSGVVRYKIQGNKEYGFDLFFF